jgi:hypothetical protein
VGLRVYYILFSAKMQYKKVRAACRAFYFIAAYAIVVISYPANKFIIMQRYRTAYYKVKTAQDKPAPNHTNSEPQE